MRPLRPTAIALALVTVATAAAGAPLRGRWSDEAQSEGHALVFANNTTVYVHAVCRGEAVDLAALVPSRRGYEAAAALDGREVALTFEFGAVRYRYSGTVHDDGTMVRAVIETTVDDPVFDEIGNRGIMQIRGPLGLADLPLRGSRGAVRGWRNRCADAAAETEEAVADADAEDAPPPPAAAAPPPAVAAGPVRRDDVRFRRTATLKLPDPTNGGWDPLPDPDAAPGAADVPLPPLVGRIARHYTSAQCITGGLPQPGQDFLRRVDLNGDGIVDYIVDENELGCLSEVSSCTAAGCGVKAFVSVGYVFREAFSGNGTGLEVLEEEPIPLLLLTVRGNGRRETQRLRWNGHEIARLR